MPMLKNPSVKYQGFQHFDLPDRQWPSKRITKAPRWLTTDLRDGNQSLASPMTIEQKWKYFDMLLRIGFKEIDVSFPSASQTEFEFTRKLVETPGAVPPDVWLQILSPCRKEFIRRTVDSVTGCKKAIISLYIAVSESFREAIFGLSQDEILEMTADCVRYAKSITKDDPSQRGTQWNLMFSPEAFSDTDVNYSVRICETVKEIWQPTEDNPIILNLPATVEVSTPNTYADQVELFCRSISEREKVCVSLHPHNDRGCAVAAVELAQMAGADRVEGCLFGNGERTGNVDLVTLALNLYTQGINPKLDFSDLKSIRTIFEECTRIPIPMRAPYSGDSVFLAYSGSHQDAIHKAFKKMDQEPDMDRRIWRVPYLTLDPQDVGLTYESIIRINSQSGKGGVSWTLQRMMQLDLPRGLQIDFSQSVKSLSERLGRTILPTEIADTFLHKYHILSQHPLILTANYSSLPGKNPMDGCPMSICAEVVINGTNVHIKGHGDDIPSSVHDAISTLNGLQLSFQIHKRDLMLENGTLHKVVMVECSTLGTDQSSWGASISQDYYTTELLASLSSVLEFLNAYSADSKLLDRYGDTLSSAAVTNGYQVSV